MKEPVEHILRPRLPWRTAATDITECGYDATKVKTITRDEFRQRRKELGSQRCAMMTCMTCSQTAERWESWEEDPRTAVGREVEWESSRWAKERGTQLKEELLAIARLIEAHPEEFQSLVSDERTRREWRERKKAEPAPKQMRPSKW